MPKRSNIKAAAWALIFVGFVWRLVARSRPPDLDALAFWATLEARCNSIARREVFGTLEERQAAGRELDELMARASRHGAPL
jgi:hypothetical protein